MDRNKLTQKSMEALQGAQALAIGAHHPQLEQIHLLAALLRQEGGLVPQLLRKMDVTVESLEAQVQAYLRRIPSVTGSREADRMYISGDLDEALNAAQAQALSNRF